MARPSDISNDELRDAVEVAFAAMRAGRGGEAVHACATAYLRFLEIHPDVKAETTLMRDRAIPRLLRWPNLGANMVPESVRAGDPKIEFERERFSVAEAMTYYQFVLDEILDKQQRAA
ncbi:MAG: hypothetical protein ACHP84_10770 [Caulobacterales bacterium]